MSGQDLCFRMIPSRRPDTIKCPRHIQAALSRLRLRFGTAVDVLSGRSGLEPNAPATIQVTLNPRFDKAHVADKDRMAFRPTTERSILLSRLSYR